MCQHSQIGNRETGVQSVQLTTNYYYTSNLTIVKQIANFEGANTKAGKPTKNAIKMKKADPP